MFVNLPNRNLSSRVSALTQGIYENYRLCMFNDRYIKGNKL